MKSNYQFQVIENAIAYISAADSYQPSLEEIAGHVHMSKFHFQRVFKKWAGISPKDFWQFLTLERAKRALKKGKSTLSTAYDVGLSGNGRLHDLFVKIEACTPGEYSKMGRDLHIKLGELDTPFGIASIAETNRGICRISFASKEDLRKELRQEYPYTSLSEELGPNGILVEQYFKDWIEPEDRILLDLQGTPFQIQVWKALLHIPSSQLVSYSDIAKAIEKPNANRAVGSAIANNPVAYLIPCHRVIRNTGELGDYRWGSDRKAAINGYEGVLLTD